MAAVLSVITLCIDIKKMQTVMNMFPNGLISYGISYVYSIGKTVGVEGGR